MPKTTAALAAAKAAPGSSDSLSIAISSPVVVVSPGPHSDYQSPIHTAATAWCGWVFTWLRDGRLIELYPGSLRTGTYRTCHD